MPIDPREQAALDLKVARADAIHNYVGVEQALSGLLATLLNISNDQAGMVASRSVHKILQGLLEPDSAINATDIGMGYKAILAPKVRQESSP